MPVATQKDLSKIGMNFYVALISEEHGLDAMTAMHTEFGEIYERELASLALPKIFKREIKDIQSKEWEKLKEQARAEANKKAELEGTYGDNMVRGVMFRKMMTGMRGEILFAPLDKKFAKEIKGKGGWEGAKIFVMVATHILKKNRTIDKLSEDDREDILDQIKAGIAMEKAKAKRSARKRR